MEGAPHKTWIKVVAIHSEPFIYKNVVNKSEKQLHFLFDWRIYVSFFKNSIWFFKCTLNIHLCDTFCSQASFLFTVSQKYVNWIHHRRLEGHSEASWSCPRTELCFHHFTHLGLFWYTKMLYVTEKGNFLKLEK